MKSHGPRLQLTEEDWNFARVPTNELVACLLWEFLRESQTAQKLVSDWCAWLGHTERGEQHNQAELFARMKALTVKINRNLYIPDFIQDAVLKISACHKFANEPWQKLPEGAKLALRESCDRVNKPVYIALALQADEMNCQVQRRSEEIEKNTPDGGTLATVFARAPLQVFKRDTSAEAICIVVDWGRYNVQAIVKGFEVLAKRIIETRPQGVVPQCGKGRGKKADEAALRPQLKNLGLARLNTRYDGITALEKHNPAAYRFIKTVLNKASPSQEAIEKLLSKAKTTFEKNFHEALPFEHAEPLCIARSRFGQKSP